VMHRRSRRRDSRLPAAAHCSARSHRTAEGSVEVDLGWPWRSHGVPSSDFSRVMQLRKRRRDSRPRRRLGVRTRDV